MRSWKILLPAALVLLIAASCEDLIGKPDTGPRTAAALTGDPPVGHWVRYLPFDQEALAESNDGRLSTWYAGDYSGPQGYEFRPDGSGSSLSTTHSTASDAFLIRGHDGHPWRAGGELRWEYAEASLLIQTTGNRRLHVTVEDEDRLTRRHQAGDEWWLRIGSPVHRRVLAFQECVKNNQGRALWEVVRCELPLPGA